MPLIVTGDQLILFVHVPKTAGSSLEAYLEARFGKLMLRDNTWTNTDLDQRSIVVSPQHIDGRDLGRLFPADRLYLSFAMVRDPTARVISEFKYQNWQYNLQLETRQRFAGLGFSVWLAMALTAARRMPTFLDNHMRPQVEMIPNGTETFRLEDGFDALIARLDAATGTRTPELEIGHELRGPAQTVSPSRQDLALIAKAYAEDFERFGYPLPDLAAAPSDPLAWIRHARGRALAPRAMRLYQAGQM